MDRRFLVLALLSAFSLTDQSSNVPPPPELTLHALDVELHETETRHTDLFPAGPIATCSDDDRARAFIQSVSPGGTKCFSLDKCGGATAGGNSSGYCLYFEPNQGSLKYTTTPEYTVTIGCTDDVEPTTTQSLTVKIISNTPPSLIPPNAVNVGRTKSGTATAPGDLIYQVETEDIDGDPVYYSMSTNPQTDFISIGYTDGKIRATNDLKFLCQDSVRATVTAKDPYNPPIGPVNLYLTIDPSNKAPYISNLDTTVRVNENVGADSTVLTLDVTDPNVFPALNFHMWSSSSAGMEQYKLETTATSAILKTKINPNYERGDTRSVTLYFDVDDGYCKANRTYFLTMNIVDINEPPQYVPNSSQSIEVYEGQVNIDTGLYVNDPDLNEVHTFSKTGASSSLFGVDLKTGGIYSLSDIDIDTNTPFKEYIVVTNVTDHGGLTSTATVKITVYDANDQKPYFLPIALPFSATECTEPGSIIGTVTGDDDDSDYNNNDKIYFGGGGGKMTVMSKGSVVLTAPCINGEFFTGSATIADQGIYPGPLQGTPATISMTCGPCPTTTLTPTPSPTTPTQAATTPSTKAAAATATTASTGAVRSTGDKSTMDLLSWLLPTVFGGLAWLALSGFLVYRYCCPCRNPFAGLCRRRPQKFMDTSLQRETPRGIQKPATRREVPPDNSPQLPVPPPPKALTPRAPPPLPPQPPQPPPSVPESDPYIYGFWKQQYTDQDMVGQPASSAKPEAVENMPPEDVVPRGNAPAPANLRLGNPGMGQHRASLPGVSE